MEATNKDTPKPGTAHRVYELDQSLGHHDQYKDGERSLHDAYLIEFPGSEEVTFCNAQPLSLPESVEFDAQTDVLGSIDYLYPNVAWPVMSKRMLDVLLSVREFPYQVIPLVLHEIPVLGEEVEMEGGPFIRTGRVNHDYVAVQLLELLDVFDWENSVYEFHLRVPGRVKPNSIKKLVLIEPEKGYPPLFRMSVGRTLLYVSAGARDALEAADIQGLRFVELRGSY